MSQKRVLRKTDPQLIALVESLRTVGREQGSPIWRDIASRLERPARLWAEVNVGKLEDVVRDGETAVVPGKVLAAGHVSRPVTVAAYKFSATARDKVTAAGGKCISLGELAKTNNKGAKCRIVG
ncbi:MAG: 50S ribosomal protein L18e [Euryarchaeota archaeon]|nr:50S ribosomal protein L18e [Euryarchaeota archaeon]